MTVMVKQLKRVDPSISACKYVHVCAASHGDTLDSFRSRSFRLVHTLIFISVENTKCSICADSPFSKSFDSQICVAGPVPVANPVLCLTCVARGGGGPPTGRERGREEPRPSLSPWTAAHKADTCLGLRTAQRVQGCLTCSSRGPGSLGKVFSSRQVRRY